MATNKIKLKKSSVPGKVPTDSDLEYGEVALNFADGRLYYKTSTNQIDFFRSDSDLGGAGSIDSAQVNDLVDAKIQVLDIADIVGSTGNPGEYLKSLGNGNAEWASLAAAFGGVDSAFVFANSLDSAETISLIDSAYINARVSTGTDSSTVITLVQSTVDSAYVQARQDFAYSSLTGAPNVLDSANVTALIGSYDTFDSAGIISLIDSSYVQARQTPQDFAYSSLTGAPNVLDSADVTGLIDSTYIQSKQLTYDFLDSAEVLILVDSAYIQARQITYDVQGTIDSSYGSVATDFLPRLDSTYDLGSPTKKWKDLYLSGSSIYLGSWILKEGPNGMLVVDSIGTTYEIPVVGDNVSSFVNDANYLDSSTVTGVIDSAYVQARQITYDFLDSAEAIALIDSAHVQARQITYSNVSEFANDANYLDSNTVTGVIDATYIQSNQTTYDFLDSAEAIALIDSAHVQARQTPQDFAYSSLTGAPNVLDSANVRNIFSGGTGVTYDNATGKFSIGQEVDSSADLYLAGLQTTGNIVVGGNLQVDGVLVTINTEDLKVTDNMIYLNAGESAGSPTASIDLGIAGNYNDDGAYRHAGFFRDATDNRWKVYEGYLPEPDASSQIDTNDSTFALAPFQAAAIYGTTLSGKYLGIDSDVDSAYVQARQDFSYSSLVGAPNVLDSADVASIAGSLSGLDSTGVRSLVDSAYVQLRQDYAYSSLTGAPNVLDSNDVSGVARSVSIDSSEAIALIDSAYVQARQITYSNLSEFNNDTNYLDSTTVTGVIDATYIQANQTTYDFLDSAETIALIDSAYVQARQITYTVLDSADVTGLIDSAYINARVTVSAGTDSATVITLIQQNSIDSAGVLSLIDSAYVQARQAVGGSGVGVLSFRSIAIAGQTTVTADDSADTLTLVAGDKITLTTGGDDVITFTVDAIDSAETISLIDSAYVQARQITYDFLDSAEATALIDSAYIQARQDFAYSSLTGTPTTFDSSSNAVFATVTTTGNLVVGGNLQVDGTTTTVDTQNLKVTDNMIYLNAGESSGSPTASIDIGFAGNYNDDGTYAHAGFFRDATDNKWKLFDGYLPEPDASLQINTGDSTFSLAPLQVGAFTATTITGAYQGFDSDFTAKSTTDLSEGTNKYYTKVRVDSDISALVDSAYINARVTASAGTDSATVISLVYANAIDSARTLALIDSDYIVSRAGNLSSLTVSGNTTISGDLSIGSAANGSISVSGSNGFNIANTSFTTTERAGAWTYSFWLYLPNSSINYPRYIGGDANAATRGISIFLGWNGSTTYSLQLENRYSGQGSNFTKTLSGELSKEQWHFITVSYNGSNTVYLGVDGDVSSVSGNAIATSQTTHGWYLGQPASGSTQFANTSGPQQFANVRLASGVTEYTSNFTVPSTNPSLGANDKVLLLSKTNGSLLTNENTGITVNNYNTSTFSSLNPIGASGNVTIANSYTLPTTDGDSNQVLATDGNGNIIFITPFDSASTLSLIDSAYIQARQLTYDFLDSAEAISLIDSAYIQARQDFRYSSLSGEPDILDSNNVISIIDSAYVQARQLTYDFLDSAEVISLIDSAYINSRVLPNIDSDLVKGLIDSDYVMDRRWGTYLFDSDTTYTVTVITKTPTHPFYAVGSSEAFAINGKEAPYIELVPGQTYTFDQSDSSNAGHPLRLYYTADKTTQFTSGVTSTGTAGTDGKTVIVVGDATPARLYYQCQFHSNMGWAVGATTHNLTGFTTDNLPEGSTNQYFTTARARSSFSQGTGVTITSGQIAIGQSVGTTSNVTFNNLTLNGNLTVSGTTTTVNTETIALADNIIELNSNLDAAVAPSQNAGIEINRGSQNDVQLRWNETTDAWEAATLDSNGGTPAYYRILTTVDSGFAAATLGGESGGYYLNFNNLANRPTSLLDLGILDGTAGQALITDGSGNFSFSTISGGAAGGVTGQTQVSRFDANATGSSAFTTAAGTFSTVQVYVNGVLAKDSADYSFNDSSGVVSFVVAPETGSEVSIYGYKTSILDIDSSGNLTITGDVKFGNHGNLSSATRTLNTGATQYVDTFDAATVRGAKYVVTVENDSDRYQISEILLIHDGLSASVTTYGTINKGGSQTNLATFNADIDSGNSLVRLLATPTTVNTVYKVTRTDMLI